MGVVFREFEGCIGHVEDLVIISDQDLFSKINILKEIIGLKNNKPIDIYNYIKKNKFFSKCVYSLKNNVNNTSIN